MKFKMFISHAPSLWLDEAEGRLRFVQRLKEKAVMIDMRVKPVKCGKGNRQ